MRKRCSSRHAAPRRRAHRSAIRALFSGLSSARVRAALGFGVVLCLGSVTTFAYWTDEATVSGGAFNAGKLDIKVGDPGVDNNPTQFTSDFAMSSMVPGSAKNATLQVTNAGTVGFTYTVGASATEAGAGSNQMGAAIRIAVYAGSSCTGAPIAGPSAPSALTVTRPALPPATGNAESLCFRASLPSNASTDLQGRSTVVTLTLTATQVTP